MVFNLDSIWLWGFCYLAKLSYIKSSFRVWHFYYKLVFEIFEYNKGFISQQLSNFGI